MRNPIAFILSLAVLTFTVACTGTPDRADWRATETQRILPIKATTARVAYAQAWRRETEQAYREAEAYIETYGATHPRGGWAVIMDIDQTVLNNVAYQIALDQRGASYSPATWYDWVEAREATLIPGAKPFIARVRELGGQVVLVSNRRSYEAEATIDNLAALGIQSPRDYAILVTRAWPDGPESKQQRFAEVPTLLQAKGLGTLSIAAYLGDVVGDAPVHGTTPFFCIPQGDLYGEPCREHRIDPMQGKIVY